MQRYAILFASVMMQLCLGATYSWSVFVSELKALMLLGQGPIQIPFTVFYIVFPATTIFAGALLERLGPRRCAMLGGLVFGCGWMLAGFGRVHFAFTVVGIGLMGGLGVGLAYLVPITTCVLWFPRHKGLVTGIAVAGFGGGAALVASVAGHWMQSRGCNPFDCFLRLGAVFALVISIAGCAMKRPPNAAEDRGLSRAPVSLLRQPAFWTLYLAMLANLMAGFAVNANVKQLIPGLNARSGAMAVGCFALANALGRIVWGFAFDRLASRTAILANGLMQSALLLSAGWMLRSEGALYVFALLAGFNYGGVLVIYASATARQWGVERMGRIYGRLFSSNIPASVAPVLAGLAFDRAGSFTLPLAAIAALCMLTAALVRLDRTIVE